MISAATRTCPRRLLSTAEEQGFGILADRQIEIEGHPEGIYLDRYAFTGTF